MEGWQPIGTAPRDGRTILVYLPIGAAHPTRRQDDVIAVTWAGAFWARATGWQAGWETPYSGIKGDVPTHWRLLPDPPERPPFE